MLRLTDLGVISALHATDPAAAADLWPALAAVEDGLGGGVEVPGGLWVLLLGVAALRAPARLLPRPLAVLGVVVGGAGLLTLVPGVEAFEAVFGLGMIAWFVWTGLVLVRTGRAAGPVPASTRVASTAAGARGTSRA